MAKKILVVDDMKPMRDILAYNLRKVGYEVEVAANGLEAVRYALAEKPDLIVLDVMMPKMDGYEVIEQLRKSKITKFIPIIFVTAKAQRTDVEKGIQLGANGYVVKPYRFSDLYKQIQSLLKPG
ncbi:MAG: response regulator [Thermodesulfobacteriota bacterium]|nr:response regulator [Thermodesulfobacteriota bacterium]